MVEDKEMPHRILGRPPSHEQAPTPIVEDFAKNKRRVNEAIRKVFPNCTMYRQCLILTLTFTKTQDLFGLPRESS